MHQSALNAYFWLLGSFAAIGAFGPLLRKASGPLGDKSIKVDVPEGLLLDEQGESVRTAEAAPSDILALVLSMAIATAEVSSNHTNFTLNNLLACLIATVRACGQSFPRGPCPNILFTQLIIIMQSCINTIRMFPKAFF